MKQKNATIGTKVKVKAGVLHSGCTGTIVDYEAHSNGREVLVQFDTEMDSFVHEGNGLTASGEEFPNSRYYAVEYLKRIKE